MRLRSWAVVLLLALAPAGCGGDGESCELTCGRRSTTRADVPTVSLACGIQPEDCDLTLDGMGRVTALMCRYTNAKFATCDGITYDAISHITAGSCMGEGQTCTLP